MDPIDGRDRVDAAAPSSPPRLVPPSRSRNAVAPLPHLVIAARIHHAWVGALAETSGLARACADLGSSLGGLGYQVVSGGGFVEDATVPYSNELFAVRYAPGGGPGGASWSQHLLGASYPTILSPASGVPFYFGTETEAFPLVEADGHGMLDLDALLAARSPVRLALLYGGIVSEGQALMSETYYGTSASNRLFEVWFEPGPGCPADLSRSGTVDGQDLEQLLAAWGPVPAGAIVRADLDGDGFVGAKDLAQLLAEWGPCPTR